MLTQQDVNPSNAEIKNNLNLTLKLVDASNGEVIQNYNIMDSLRLARKGDEVYNDKTIVLSSVLPSSLLSDFIVDPNSGFNIKSCVEALGLYNTDYIRDRIETMGDKNSDLGAIENATVEDDLIFRNYIKGGTSPVKMNADGTLSTKTIRGEVMGNERLTPNLGVGLGEAFVLNPTHQYNKRDDVRTNPMYTKIGRVYSTQIMNNWPIAIFQPGRLKYNTGFFKMLGLGSGAGFTEALIRSGGDGLSGLFLKMVTAVTDLVSVVGTTASAIFGGSRVVEFKQSINLYKQYYRFLSMSLAGMMGLYTENRYHGSIHDLNLNHILPTNSMQGGPEKMLNDQYIPFRCAKGIIGSETFSNSTSSNPLMEEMNDTAEANAEEANGIAGSGSFVEKLMNFGKRAALGAAGKFSESAMVLSGKGRITLPDVFSSSSFSRSFNCDFKFHSPYGDNLSIFENCYLQFLALAAMSIPRQTGKLSYTSPFAVRVFVKNHIMINYGMIETLSVTRGGDSNDWTPSGFPKTLSVSVTVKDMEPNISLPLASRGPLRASFETMFPATGMSEYLSTLGGLTLDQMTHHFRTERLLRASGMFFGGWSAKLNPANMMTSIVNTRPVANIVGLFNSVDLDRYNRLGDVMRDNANGSMKNTIQMKFGAPAYPFHSLSLNGTAERYGTLASVKREESDYITSIIKESTDSVYSEEYTKK